MLEKKLNHEVGKMTILTTTRPNTEDDVFLNI